MSARTLAILVCLLIQGPHLAGAESAGRKARQLVVYLKTDPGQSLQTIVGMKDEASALLSAAGYTLSWRSIGGSNLDAGDAALVVIELRGVCKAPQPAAPVYPLASGDRLASTAVVNGQVIPYSQLECENLTRLLGPSLSKEASGRRTFLYGRAMGRLVAHEIFHALVKTGDHDAGGIAKRSFSLNDVLAERFEFGPTALDRIRDSDGFPAATDNLESGASGR